MNDSTLDGTVKFYRQRCGSAVIGLSYLTLAMLLTVEHRKGRRRVAAFHLLESGKHDKERIGEGVLYRNSNIRYRFITVYEERPAH